MEESLSTDKRSYGIEPVSYLKRARLRLNEGTREALFYAAFELRCGIEARLQEYLDARQDIAQRKNRGWKIIESAKELDRQIKLGDKIAEVGLLDDSGKVITVVFHTPITGRLRNTACDKLDNLRHAMKRMVPDDDPWWVETRSTLEQIYSDLFLACKGTLLGPLLIGPDKCVNMILSFDHGSGVPDKMAHFGVEGTIVRVGIRYHESLPDYAAPFLRNIT